MNLSTLLVLTTLFIGNVNSLPKTSSLKLMDIWLIFTLLVPFVDVLLQMAMDILEEDEDDIAVVPAFIKQSLMYDKARNGKCRKFIKVVTNVGMPLMFIVFCIMYFSYAALVRLNSA